MKQRDPEEADGCENGNCRKCETKIVPENELMPHLDRGWAMVKELKNGGIVIGRSLQLEDST